MCEKIAQLTKVVSNLHSETEDAREREKEMEEEHSNTIELCRADAARKVLETHSKWREEANEKERFERIANELEAKTRIMQSGVDEALRRDHTRSGIEIRCFERKNGRARNFV